MNRIRIRYASYVEPTVDRIKHKIRDIPNFPKEGIIFKDLTPVMGDADILQFTVNEIVKPFVDTHITAVAGMEARGFIFGSLAAVALNCGFVPLRKGGKLPYETYRATYQLEYGEATLEMHVDAVGADDQVLLVDDLIATGGTAAASCKLIEMAGASVAACAFVVELDFLKGRDAISGYTVHSLVHY